MNKKMLALALAMAFTVGTVAVGFARDIKCEITAVDGNTVTMDCGSNAKKLAVGTTAEVKPGKKKAQEASGEGC